MIQFIYIYWYTYPIIIFIDRFKIGSFVLLQCTFSYEFPSYFPILDSHLSLIYVFQHYTLILLLNLIICYFFEFFFTLYFFTIFNNIEFSIPILPITGLITFAILFDTLSGATIFIKLS